MVQSNNSTEGQCMNQLESLCATTESDVVGFYILGVVPTQLCGS